VVRELRLSDRLLRDAAGLGDAPDVLDAELWAAGWLGHAWQDAGPGEPEREPERLLCLEVAGRALTRPSPAASAALAALRRVAPGGGHGPLDEAIAVLDGSQAAPRWRDTPAFAPVRAWRAVDVWDSERILFVEFALPGDDATRHCLVAQIINVSGTMIEKLAVLSAGAAALWEEAREPGDPPMPAAGAPLDQVLAEMADALRATDMVWPRPEEGDYAYLRALAWARCAAYLPDWPEFAPLPDDERQALIAQFVTGGEDGDPAVAASLAGLFLDYGDGYLHARPLGWSPYAIDLFLADWLPRKAVLDAGQREALIATLHRWVRFAGARRGLAEPWIEALEEAIDKRAGEFAEAFDDADAWGPAKQIAAALAERGVDLDDRAAVGQAVHALNAERLAKGLIDPGQ
jgi:hypothetical protein